MENHCRKNVAVTDRTGSHTAGIRQPFLQPNRWVQESLHAEVPEDGTEILANLIESLNLFIKLFSLTVL